MDALKIKKGEQYKFIPNGLSDVEKIVTVESDPVWNPVIGEDVVKVAELFGLCPIKCLYELDE